MTPTGSAILPWIIVHYPGMTPPRWQAIHEGTSGLKRYTYRAAHSDALNALAGWPIGTSRPEPMTASEVVARDSPTVIGGWEIKMSRNRFYAINQRLNLRGFDADSYRGALDQAESFERGSTLVSATLRNGVFRFAPFEERRVDQRRVTNRRPVSAHGRRIARVERRA